MIGLKMSESVVKECRNENMNVLNGLEIDIVDKEYNLEKPKQLDRVFQKVYRGIMNQRVLVKRIDGIRKMRHQERENPLLFRTKYRVISPENRLRFRNNFYFFMN